MSTRTPAATNSSRARCAPGGARPIIGDPRARRCGAGDRPFRPDVVVDLILISGTRARALRQTVRGRATRIVAISSIDVYRTCGLPSGSEPGPLTESSPLSAHAGRRAPAAQRQCLGRAFGWRDDEDDTIPAGRAVLGDAELPGTVVRLAMIPGPADRLHRLAPLLARIDAGRPAIGITGTMAPWLASREATSRTSPPRSRSPDDPRRRRPSLPHRRRGEARGDPMGSAGRRSGGMAWRLAILLNAPASLRLPCTLAHHGTTDSSRIRQERGYRSGTLSGSRRVQYA